MAHVRLKKREEEPEPRPHNAKGPIDLRKHPVCYLCGHHWKLWDDPKPKYAGMGKGFDYMRTWRVVIQCIGCVFLTFAYADEAVMHSRGWRKHRR
jgi:hypothetical protein